MYSQVIKYIKQRIEISQEAIEESLTYSDFKKYKKGEYILKAGEYCRFIGFLNKGFIVTTIVDEAGNERAAEFKHEGCFLLIRKVLPATALHIRILLLLKIAKHWY